MLTDAVSVDDRLAGVLGRGGSRAHSGCLWR
jgi:hypothetical protein